MVQKGKIGLEWAKLKSTAKSFMKISKKSLFCEFNIMKTTATLVKIVKMMLTRPATSNYYIPYIIIKVVI